MLPVFLSPNFTLRPVDFKVEGCRKSEMHWMTLNTLSKVAFMQLIFINEVQICDCFALRGVFEIQGCQKSQISALNDILMV